jgi:hypothetical protein
MRRVLEQVSDFLWNVNLGTWIAHAAQGFAVAALFDIAGDDGRFAFLALAYHGGARELPGLKRAVQAGDTPLVVDGMLDYACFFVGMALYYAIFGGAR